MTSILKNLLSRLIALIRKALFFSWNNNSETLVKFPEFVRHTEKLNSLRLMTEKWLF